MKKLFMAFLMIVLSISLIACSSNSEKTSTKDNAASKNKSVTIKYWYWADNADYSKKMQSIIADFNKTNGKGITVIGQEQPWNGGAYSQTLFTAAMGGGGPDVSAFKLTSTPLFTGNKLLVNLDDYVNSWKDKNEIDSNLYKVMKQAGGSSHQYVMPWNTQILYVYYRPSYFQKAGVQVPKTYDEFLTAIKKTTMDINGQHVYGFGMRGGTGGQEPWGSFIHAEGGDFLHLNNAASIKGMQDYVNLYKNGYVPPTAPTDGFNEILANFLSGKTAMTIHHTGSEKQVVAKFGDDVSAFPFPKGKGQWTSMGDTENVIFASSKNKEAAFDWISYLATGKGQEEWCKTTGNVPVSKKVQAEPFFKNDKFMQASIQGMSYAGVLPIKDSTTAWISTVWPNTVSSALLGKTPVKDAMDTLQTKLNK